MRIIISAGGTGGGMYPAFAVAEALQNKDEAFAPPTLMFIGGAKGMERAMLSRSGIDWAQTAMVQGGPVRGVSPVQGAANAIRLGVGMLQAWGWMRRVRPARVFLTGGWASLSVGLAAWLAGVPILTFVPDIEPGATIRLVSRLARRVATTTNESAVYFRPGQVVETGYPLRRSVLAASREEAIARFGLDPARQTLLVVGGSSGAHSLNRALLAILPQLLADGVQVLHLSGTLDWPEVQKTRQNLTSQQQADYHAFDYLHGDMGLALAAADLAVSRAGASTLGEFPHFGLPAILVPYPYAWRYQKVNADYLVARGAAVRLDDEALADELYPAIRKLLAEPARLSAMAACARALARPDGARNIARLLIELEAA